MTAFFKALKEKSNHHKSGFWTWTANLLQCKLQWQSNIACTNVIFYSVTVIYSGVTAIYHGINHECLSKSLKSFIWISQWVEKQNHTSVNLTKRQHSHLSKFAFFFTDISPAFHLHSAPSFLRGPVVPPCRWFGTVQLRYGPVVFLWSRCLACFTANETREKARKTVLFNRWVGKKNPPRWSNER